MRKCAFCWICFLAKHLAAAAAMWSKVRDGDLASLGQSNAAEFLRPNYEMP